MLRIHFTGVDLARVRMAGRPDALWETILSFHRIRDRRDARLFGEWRTESRTRLNGETRLLGALIPSRGYFPDFLTPMEGQYGMDAGLDALRETRPQRLRAELALLTTEQEQPTRLREIADGQGPALARLASVLRAYHRAAVEPYWARIQAQVEAERAARGRAVLDGGADELLASLPPMLRWNPPVLECDYPVDRDVQLGGRGLLLQPSFFCRRTAVTLHDPGLSPVLVYPAQHASSPVGAEPSRARDGLRGLGKLVGHTRSVVLRAIGDGATTSELARRAGVSLASASQHACVMREAGLVTTLRHGNAVLHTVTPLGAALLKAGS
ncbi:helix-turn-helix domain-containing protein [Streptomyces sp. NPDC006879]|uniref:ArsR/SmtB family transcription factor n=1 Tax=Streptomyces sp. NPDC006879 TaxID=3364767 RepID=UPI003676727A